MKLMEERASREEEPETENYAENPIEKMKAENKTVVEITLNDLASYLNHQRELKHQALRQKAAEAKGE